VARRLRQGETIRLGTAWFMIAVPDTEGEAAAPTLVAPRGRYRVGPSGFPLRRAGRDSDEHKWATAPVEIRIDDKREGPESTLSEVLLGRRRLNTRHIGILSRYFRIDPGVFLDVPAE
jgi:hypothetical protein